MNSLGMSVISLKEKVAIIVYSYPNILIVQLKIT